MRSKNTADSLYCRCGGYALLIMLLLIVVLGALVWLDPSALLGKDDKNLPWNQTRRIMPEDKAVPLPKPQQPQLAAHYIGLQADCHEDGQDRGQVKLAISPAGRVSGTWSANYFFKPDVRHEVVMSRFEGNIDPDCVYKDDSGEDPNRLYIITKGSFMVLETKEKSGQMRKASGKLYMTGWLSPDYILDGKVTITSDKRNYYEYRFKGLLTKKVPMLDGGNLMPGLLGK